MTRRPADSGARRFVLVSDGTRPPAAGPLDVHVDLLVGRPLDAPVRAGEVVLHLAGHGPFHARRRRNGEETAGGVEELAAGRAPADTEMRQLHAVDLDRGLRALVPEAHMAGDLPHIAKW